MTTKRHSTEVRQKQIIDAARMMIVKYGSEHVTVRRIAKEVGISEAAIYRHFKNKRDILLLLADHIEENLMNEIKINPMTKGYSLSEISAVIRDHIAGIEQRQVISYQVIAEIISYGDKKLNQRYFEVVSKYIDHLSEMLSMGIKSGELRQDIDPRVAATQLYGMIQGIVGMWALSNYKFNLLERYDPLWELFRDSIARKPAGKLSR